MKKLFNKKTIIIGILLVFIICLVICYFIFNSSSKENNKDNKPDNNNESGLVVPKGYHIATKQKQLPTYDSHEEALIALKKEVKKDNITYSYEKDNCWYFTDGDVIYECCKDDYIFRSIIKYNGKDIESAK